LKAFEITIDLRPDEAKVLTRQTLAAGGFGALSEIDGAATLKGKLGMELHSLKILPAGNPASAHRALGVHPTVALLLPCNVVMQAVVDRSRITAINPHRLLDVPRFDQLATEAVWRLEAAIATVSDEA
jgi:uncharacterized protein (DUF302 family)